MIIVKNLWKKYGSLQVLRGLNLTCPTGKTTVILGRSGVGKSVLLKHILGLEQADEGTIVVNDIPITSISEKELYKATQHFGMLFQGSALFDSMNIGQNVAFYLTEHGDMQTGRKIPADKIASLVDESLQKVGLKGYENKMPSQLSGGQKRRAALARLLIYKPKILLYDEPTTGLDPITSMQINELIIETNRALGATTILVTHDIRSAIEVGDYFALHHEGKIAYAAEKAAFIQSDNPLIQDFFRNAIITPEYVTQMTKQKG